MPYYLEDNLEVQDAAKIRGYRPHQGRGPVFRAKQLPGQFLNLPRGDPQQAGDDVLQGNIVAEMNLVLGQAHHHVVHVFGAQIDGAPQVIPGRLQFRGRDRLFFQPL